MYCYRLREMRARSTGSRSPGPRSQYPASRSHHPVSNIQCPVHSYGIFRIRFALLVGRRPSVFSYGSQKTPCSYLRIGLRFCPWLPLPMPMSMSMPIVTSGGGCWGSQGGCVGGSAVVPFNVPGNAHRNFSTLTLAAFCCCCCCFCCIWLL